MWYLGKLGDLYSVPLNVEPPLPLSGLESSGISVSAAVTRSWSNPLRRCDDQMKSYCILPNHRSNRLLVTHPHFCVIKKEETANEKQLWSVRCT